MSAPHTSLPGDSSRIGVHGPRRPLGPRRTTLAPTASCPSRNTVAVTWNVSPATAFAGRLPHSTAGRTSRTGTRPMAGVLRMDLTSAVREAGHTGPGFAVLDTGPAGAVP